MDDNVTILQCIEVIRALSGAGDMAQQLRSPRGPRLSSQYPLTKLTAILNTLVPRDPVPVPGL